MVQPPFPFSTHLWPPLTPSASTPPLPPPLCSNSEAYLRNLCNCIAPTLGLTVDQYQTWFPCQGPLSIYPFYIRKQCPELLEAQGAMRASIPYREVIVSASAR